jgi:hypothetical protein
MGARKPLTFEEEIEQYPENSPQYNAVMEKWAKVWAAEQKARQAQAYKHKMVIRIMEYCGVLRNLNRSKLGLANNEELEEIGKAARGLYEALQKAGLTSWL